MNRHTLRISLRNGAVTAAATLAFATTAFAQQAPDEGGSEQDPGIVIARVVMPRTAYRGVPTEDNPIHTRATTFPSQLFHDTMDRTLGNLLGDGELSAATGSAGVIPQATQTLTQVLVGDASATGAAGLSTLTQNATLGAPLGLGASASPGGAIGQVTGSIAGQITGALNAALPGAKP